MKSQVFRVIILLMIVGCPAMAQYQISGSVHTSEGKLIQKADIYNETSGQTITSDQSGHFSFEVPKKGTYKLSVFSHGYDVSEQVIHVEKNVVLNVRLKTLSVDLTEVVIEDEKEKTFNLKRLNPVEGTAIYAGKKMRSF